MSTTLTNGTDLILPEAVLGYRSTRAARTIIHDILDRADPDVSLREAALRKGTLDLFIVDEDKSSQAESLLAGASVWTVSDPDRLTIAMSFVVAEGEIERELDDATRNVWIVRVPFREVIL